MQRSLRSFKFFMCSFWFHKSYKNCKFRKKKERKRTLRSFYKVKKERDFLFSQYIYIYISIDIYICISIYRYIYLYIYIEHSAFFCKRTKRSRILLHFFAFFYVLCKRTVCSFGFYKSPKTPTLQKLQPCNSRTKKCTFKTYESNSDSLI